MEGEAGMGYGVKGRKVLVTGASSGIGAALARALAAAGATVGICARRGELLDEVLADCHAAGAVDSRSWIVDLADLDGIEDFARRADDELGGIDVLVNNAGIPKRRVVTDLTPAVVEDVMRLNYLSPVRLTLALLPRMLERGEGRIVNISSVAARLSPPHEAAYAASKAALTAFTEAASVDLADTAIRFHLVNPGVIDTPLFSLADNEPSISDLAPETPEAMASAIVEQLEQGTFELWFPGWFADVAKSKADDVEGFLAGSAAYLRSRR